MDRMESDPIIHDCEAFERWLRGRQLEESTIRNYVSSLKRLSRDLEIEIGPATIGGREDAVKVADRFMYKVGKDDRSGRTAAHNYADFVQASSPKQEDDETRFQNSGYPPTRRESYPIVLDLLRRMEMPVKTAQVGTAFADCRGLTAAQRAEISPDGKRKHVNWYVAWALSDLRIAGFLSKPSRGMWTLTEDGRRLSFDVFLERYKKHMHEQNRQRNEADDPDHHDMSEADDEIEAEADWQEAPEPYDVDSALRDLFVSRDQLTRILDSIKRRKNLILQGPPGVGKTFIARRIAWCLIGHKDSSPIEMVQFHQSYAYEDFVQGWRPTETGGFTLRNGVFFEFCERARKHPNTAPFVFIIDEINRGNLSRIFGELLMLIEADKRGPKYAIPLTYGDTGERFSVPENVHILGLMNTADRSLAMVDYALRRRFAFETLEPAYRTGEFREYLIEAGVDESLVNRINDSISAINERIREDEDLGPGFQIGHSYFVPSDDEDSPDERWFRTIVDTQIEPLLREYWFDHPEAVDELLEALRP